ncbi:MAG: endonuclease III domain-containing protein [Candidatus Eisenbacteria bacterium]|nr:endonuclease III domain-containing protein [Candidatus Eisenbacteria bacterium]
MAVGAVLTQGTAWRNAERAIDNLRREGALCPEGLSRISPSALRKHIAAAGFQRRKAATLGLLSELAGNTETGWRALLATPATELRGRLQSVRGIGPETADAILLYAGRCPAFVIDAYTRRFAVRHALADRKAGYAAMKELFESSLPADPDLYAEYHALLVALGKEFCRTQPRCADCPLRRDLPEAR